MIKKYILPALRHLWRHRLFTTLNIFGLAISISACWVIYRIASYEFSYDKQLGNNADIYRVTTGMIFNEKETYYGGVSAPLYQSVQQQVAGLVAVAPLFYIWVNTVEISTTAGKPFTKDDVPGIAATDSSYFNMVPYKWLAGSKSTALLAPESVVLTASRAKEYFPNVPPEKVLNHTITYYSYNDTVQRTVTGVVADLPAPTEFTTQEFCTLPTTPYELNAWTNTNGGDKLYLQLQKGISPATITKQIDNIVRAKTKEWAQKNNNSFEFKRWFQLLPLTESHFSTYIDEYDVRKASKPVMYGLLGIAIFLLLLACINYINMSIAGIPQRAKEIGVRKTLGSSKSELIGQFVSETILTTLAAGVLSYLFGLLGFWLLKDIVPVDVKPLGKVFELLAFIAILAVVVTLLAGLYPAWLITKVKAVSIFRNTAFSYKKTSGFSLQKSLIVFQFVIALVFITSALIVGNQLHYALATDMGFNKEAVVLAEVPWKYIRDEKYANKQLALLTELKQIPGIQNIALGEQPMKKGYSSSQYQYSEPGKEPIKQQVSRKPVDTAYLRLYGVPLLAGRNLRASDTMNEFVLNETAVRAFGFTSPQQALGKMIGQPSSQLFPIVGVVKDFHQQDFYKTIDPLLFHSEKESLSTFNIKLSANTAQWQKTIAAIEKAWYQFYPPESFSYSFYDEAIAKLYQQEAHLAKLINIATAISIFISCLGVFGLSVLTAFQRTKEIGIRKVLGASVAGIVQLLSKDYMVLVTIAIVISVPIAWWAMHKWLQDFAYRIEIQWWMFVLAGIAAIAFALLTVSFQAIKAAIANPVKSLRTE